MASIKEFIKDQVLLPRLQKNVILIVYDPELRYYELCQELASDTIEVIDASKNSIESRENALKTLNALGNPRTKLKGMLVYVPAKAPLTDEEKQRDPFALYTVCGSLFPEHDGDEFINICLRAKSDYSTEIRRIFNENPNPTFAVIDALSDGKRWPNLQATLRVESARDIIFALLVPSDAQKKELEKQETWVSEAKDLLSTCIGLNLITRSKKWFSIADELWRFLLFSEFVFDLPEELPNTLKNVPRAPEEARPLIEDLCDQLRNDYRKQALYIEKAEAIEKELDLPKHCSSLRNLGTLDTFPFEERCFFEQAIDALMRDNPDSVRSILKDHSNSVWVGKGESQAQWALIRAALNLCEACGDSERQLVNNARNMDALIDHYIVSLREVDRLQREFEQAVGDYIDDHTVMEPVIKQGRKCYRRLMSKVQNIFIRNLETSGWPPVGRLSNTDVFDKLVGSKLQESGRKVAYILVDALRYELGVSLEKQLSEEGKVELKPAFAQLPTITNVGMASLLPGARQTLSLEKDEKAIIPVVGGVKLKNVAQRMEFLKQRYGERFYETTLFNFIRNKTELFPHTELLVLRSVEIDNDLERSPERTLGLVHENLKRIRVAINKLEKLGFTDVVIATDHGFFLNTDSEAGDICTTPAGNWINIHDRFLLGNGKADSSNFVLPAENVGIRGDFAQVAGPRNLVPYRAGELYFHGGASLQECIVPTISIKFSTKVLDNRKPSVELTYRNGASRITTRLPVINVELKAKDLISYNTDFEILLEAQDKEGNVVGEAKAGGQVNLTTGTITLKPGDRLQVTLKMQPEFEGKFSVIAMNPINLVEYCKIDLETDYVV